MSNRKKRYVSYGLRLVPSYKNPNKQVYRKIRLHFTAGKLKATRAWKRKKLMKFLNNW